VVLLECIIIAYKKTALLADSAVVVMRGIVYLFSNATSTAKNAVAAFSRSLTRAMPCYIVIETAREEV
jgi:hypothetical protein